MHNRHFVLQIIHLSCILCCMILLDLFLLHLIFFQVLLLKMQLRFGSVHCHQNWLVSRAKFEKRENFNIGVNLTFMINDPALTASCSFWKHSSKGLKAGAGSSIPRCSTLGGGVSENIRSNPPSDSFKSSYSKQKMRKTCKICF